MDRLTQNVVLLHRYDPFLPAFSKSKDSENNEALIMKLGWGLLTQPELG